MKPHFLSRNRTVFVGDILFIFVCVLGSVACVSHSVKDFMISGTKSWSCLLLHYIIKPLVYYRFGLYRRLWAYASIRELKLIAIAVSTASIIVNSLSFYLSLFS